MLKTGLSHSFETVPFTFRIYKKFKAPDLSSATACSSA